MYFCALCDQVIDLPAAKNLPQETEIFQFGAQDLIFSSEPVINDAQMLVLSIEPPVGVIQPVVVVQRLVIAIKHLSDNLFQLFD